MTIECACFGQLGQDAEQKVSKTSKPYLRFSMRVGNDDAAQWISVLSFDPSALSLNEWTNADGVVKTGLSVLSWHCRLAQIGRNKAKRDGERASVAAGQTYHSPRSAPAGRLPGSSDDASFDDPIPFGPEVR